jgi:hypothetical protein
MSSIQTLALECHATWGKPAMRYEYYLEEGWRKFVHDCGGILRQTLEVPLTPGTREFSLPSDWKNPLRVYVGYTPRSISSISRDGSTGTVTVSTATAHGLGANRNVAISGVTGAGGPEFNGSFSIYSATPPTTFTYIQTGLATDTGSGTDMLVSAPLSFLELKTARPWEVTSWQPDYAATAGRPYQYYCPDALTLAVNPVSDGSDPSLFYEYDAEVPAGRVPIVLTGLDPTADLSVPGWVESGLKAYAAFRLGDDAQGLSEFQAIEKQWRAARVEIGRASCRERV